MMTHQAKTLTIAVSIAAAAAALTCSAAQAAEPHLGTFGDWNAFQDGTGKDKVCYASSSPKTTAPQNVQRGKNYLLISNLPGDKKRYVFEFHAGYPYKEGVDVDVAVDNNKPFKLFTKDDAAWARDDATDVAIADAMKKGKTLTVAGTSARGTKTTDTFSLNGISAALGAIDKECKI
jgi:hypothetical protein